MSHCTGSTKMEKTDVNRCLLFMWGDLCRWCDSLFGFHLVWYGPVGGAELLKGGFPFVVVLLLLSPFHNLRYLLSENKQAVSDSDRSVHRLSECDKRCAVELHMQCKHKTPLWAWQVQIITWMFLFLIINNAVNSLKCVWGDCQRHDGKYH